jgi:hypothetical protein
MGELSTFVNAALDYQCEQVEEQFGCPVMSYVGQIHQSVQEEYIEAIERIAAKASAHTNPRRIVISLTTPGGVVEAVEKMVEVTRHHFDEVYFAVPLFAMSAGTIFCMSGDKIYMDYTSSLGPIDPQVANPDGHLVPALGYTDKVEELIHKSLRHEISNAELLMLQRLDLATLRRYEQARDLSISLLKKWLVRYKFKDWDTHQTTNIGAPVTEEEKIARAEEIATALSSNQRWHSHGRMIGLGTLANELKLKIEDYTDQPQIRAPLRAYSKLLVDYLDHHPAAFRIHFR